MRLQLIFFFLTGHLICTAQYKTVSIEVEYQQFQELNAFHTFTSSYGTLFAANNISIYKEYDNVDFSNEKPFNREEARPFDKNIEREFSDNYLKIDNVKKEMLLFGYILQNQFLVEDIYHEFKWDITTENKIIDEYLCIKATTNYRGREWTAWFIQDIPLSFGPWKLHGLPGLILEASDTTNRYSFKVVKIEFKNSELFKKDFNNLMVAYNKKPVHYRQFLADKEEHSNNFYKEISQDKNITIERHKPPLPNGIELKYEWEN